MSVLEDKILGKNKVSEKNIKRKDYLSADTVWFVSRDDCGTSMFNGRMVQEMLSAKGKHKARCGQQKFSDGGFIFQRRK